MKRILILVLLLFSITSIVGCTANSPFGSNTIDAIAKPSYSCEANKSTTLSKLAYFLINPITTQVQSISVLIFSNIILNTAYKNILRIMLVLYLAIYGILVATSLVQIKVSDLINRLVKIGILLVLLTDTAYNFFNDYLFKLFTTGSYDLLTVVTNPYCDTSQDQINFFSFFTYAIDSIFTSGFLARLTALLFAFPIGWICFFVLTTVMCKYLFAVIKAIIAYLFAFTAIALLISLGPIFIALILFDKTRDIFNKWIAAIITFALEPVILFAAIFFVTMFIDEALQNVLTQCKWSPIMTFYINLGGGFKADLFQLYWYLPSFIENVIVEDSNSRVVLPTINFSAFLTYFSSLIVLYLCVDLLERIPDYVKKIASKLLGGSSGAIGSGPSAKSVAETAKGLVGKDKGSVERRENWNKSSGKEEEKKDKG